MSVEYIDCKAVAQLIKSKVTELTFCPRLSIIKPCLAFIQVGNDPASNSYVKYKLKDCEELKITAEIHKFNKSVNYESISRLIKDLNKRSDIHGIMIQLPLPPELNYWKTDLLNLIAPEKDVDGLSAYNQGLITNSQVKHLIPCTPLGVMKLLQSSFIANVINESKKALVVGRSDLVGKPLAQLLVNDGYEVTVVHSEVSHNTILKLMEESDIICLATGKAHYFAPKTLKENAVVIDIGTSCRDGKLYGDFDGSNIDSSIHYFATPVPGGIGPLTRASLMLNLGTTYNNQIKGV